MIISLNWLKKYIELGESTAELEKLLTFAGIEVEAVKELPALPKSVISAKVVSAVAVPKTDHLQQCLVDIGEYDYPEKNEAGYVQVICGAPNCQAGMMAIIALPGSELPGYTIGKAKIRGVESHGMLCSEKELGISDNHAGIIELPYETAIGISVNDLYDLPDTIFELEITPNRPDLLGYLGIARDLSAKLSRPLIMPDTKIEDEYFAKQDLALKLVINDTEKCPRYTARLFVDVQTGQSPLWMKTALIKSGLRPISNLVDITNFVMLEYGHPLHAFDYARLRSLPGDTVPAIVVRRAEDNETFTALDGKTYTLDSEDLVIGDGESPSALAGVMGSEQSGINPETCMVVLESAAFHPGSIRRTSYKLKLSTDSSYRFERHLSDHATDAASLRAAKLICELANGKLCPKVHDNWPNPSQPQVLGIRPSRYKQVIGYELNDNAIMDYLKKLGLKFIQYGCWIPGKITDVAKLYCHHAEEMKQGKTEFTELPDCVHTQYYEIPPYRIDLEREIDLIEELARLDGYDKVPVKTIPRQVMDRHAYRVKKVAAEYIVSRGFFETLNYSFSDSALMLKLGYAENDPKLDMLRLKNPQSSNQSAMRTSLVPQLLQNLVYNLNHGEKNIKLFELGKTYHKAEGLSYEPYHLAAALCGRIQNEHWQNKAAMINASYPKGVVEELLDLLGLRQYTCQPASEPFLQTAESSQYLFQGKQVAYYGKLRADIAQTFGIDTLELKQDIWILEMHLEDIIEATRNFQRVFNELSRFPSVVRDISFLIADSIGWQDIHQEILSLNPDLICELSPFDEYRGKQVPSGYRSLSLHLKIQDKEKTLTDERVDQLVELVIKTLQDKWQITMR